jgi:hypothetical protein
MGDIIKHLLNKTFIVKEFPANSPTFFRKDDEEAPEKGNSRYYITKEDLARRELNKQIANLMKQSL